MVHTVSLIPRLKGKEGKQSGNKVSYDDYNSLIPRPTFHHLQYGKAGRAWYLFSRVHDIIKKIQNKQAAFHILLDYTLGVYYNRPPILDTCDKLPATLAVFAVLGTHN